MDASTRTLFGKFPRSVGNPSQWFVHSDGEFQRFLEASISERNVYASISNVVGRGVTQLDKVFYDFDSPMKEAAFPTTTAGHEKVAKMREDPDLAEEVLGDVCSEAGDLAALSRELEIPVIGVFSGFGLHVHQLFQPEIQPMRRIKTTARMFVDKLNLSMMDGQVIGDTQRLARVPNCERIYVENEDDWESPRHRTDLWTIPLTRDELIEFGPQDLLEKSVTTRQIEVPSFEERKEMHLFEDYRKGQKAGSSEWVELDVDFADIDDEALAGQLKDLLQMPCMYERVVQPNPHHMVRMNFAVMMYNLGYSKDQIHNIIRRLGWIDYKPGVTSYMLDNIRKNGYSDMSCGTLMGIGLCTREENQKECSTYQWSGGKCEWK